VNIIEPKLAGLRILLVEDSFLVAASTATLLRDLGCRVVGPFNNSDDARSAVRSGGCDAAVLDINLGIGTSEPIAEDLAGHGVPFLFVTSYASPALSNPRFASSPRIQKPLSRTALAAALVRSVGARAGENPPADPGRQG
jgi:DNA-binding NarL/FixJ family response regulator